LLVSGRRGAPIFSMWWSIKVPGNLLFIVDSRFRSVRWVWHKTSATTSATRRMQLTVRRSTVCDVNGIRFVAKNKAILYKSVSQGDFSLMVTSGDWLVGIPAWPLCSGCRVSTGEQVSTRGQPAPPTLQYAITTLSQNPNWPNANVAKAAAR
jgi:hypothetical protein